MFPLDPEPKRATKSRYTNILNPINDYHQVQLTKESHDKSTVRCFLRQPERTGRSAGQLQSKFGILSPNIVKDLKVEEGCRNGG